MFAAIGVQALNILLKVQPDAVLIDIRMPDMDGIETTRRLKTVPQFVALPVIMASGNSEGASVRDSMKAGATDLVVKPYDRDSILPKVARALRR